jgi:hypothetical protein
VGFSGFGGNLVALVVFRAHVLDFSRELGAWLLGLGTKVDEFCVISIHCEVPPELGPGDDDGVISRPGSSAVLAGISLSGEDEFLCSFVAQVFVVFVGEIVVDNNVLWAIMSLECEGKVRVV